MQMPWQTLAPQTDFYGAFIRPLIDKGALDQARLANEKQTIENKYLGPTREQQLMQLELGNEMSRMKNQQTEEAMPFNIPMLEAALSAKLLGNENSRLKNQFMPQEHSMNQALKNMQIQKYRAELEQLANPQGPDPFQGPSSVQEWAWIQKLRAEGNNDQADQLEKLAMGGNASIFSKMPADYRRRELARADSLGISASDAITSFDQGLSPDDLARSRGMDEKQIAEAGYNYAPTVPNLTRAQNQIVASVGAEYLNEQIAQRMEPFINAVNLFPNYSTKQIVDYVTETNPESDELIAGLIAASGVVPEQAALRARQTGANLGIEAIKHFEETSPIKIRAITELANERQMKLSWKDFNKMNEQLAALEIDVATNLPKYQDRFREVVKEVEGEQAAKTAEKEMETPDFDNMTYEEQLEYGRQQGWVE